MSSSELSQFQPGYGAECPDESNVRDYIALLKPRVMTLVVFTGIAGLWLAPGSADMHPLLVLVSVFALALGAGAAGAVNMWYDRDIDALMNRTKTRPIPAGLVNAPDALAFALVCSGASIMLLGLASNWLAAIILAFANIFYSVFYTMYLKRRTPQNIVIGGAAGAFPPLIGWAAASGEISLFPLCMFVMIFLWTPPHFWALSLYACKDYERAGVPMLPVVKGEKATRRHIFFYTLIMVLFSLVPWFAGYTGAAYLCGNVILGALFLLGAGHVLTAQDKKSAVQLFAYSIFYLFAWFLLLIIDYGLS